MKQLKRKHILYGIAASVEYYQRKQAEYKPKPMSKAEFREAVLLEQELRRASDERN